MTTTSLPESSSFRAASPRRRTAAELLFSLLLSSVYLAPALAFPEPPVYLDDESERITGLIRQLGSNDYQERTLAFQQLIDAGEEAVEPLERAQRAADSEIRLSAERILRLIEQRSFEKRLKLFLSDDPQGSGALLEGWQEFASIAGTERAARELFARMYESYWPLFRNIRDGYWHRDPDLLAKENDLFRNANSSSIRLLYASVAGTFLLSIQAKEEQDDDRERLLRSKERRNRELALLTRMADTRLKTYVATGGYQFEFDAVVGNWIRHLPMDDSAIAVPVISMIAATELKGATGSLAEIAMNDEFSINARCNALQAIALTGNESDVERIAQLVSNDEMLGHFSGSAGPADSRRSVVIVDGVVEVVSNRSGLGSGNSVEVCIGDVALLASVILAGRQPGEFGFPDAGQEEVERRSFALRQAGFPDRQGRAEARRRWYETVNDG